MDTLPLLNIFNLKGDPRFLDLQVLVPDNGVGAQRQNGASHYFNCVIVLPESLLRFSCCLQTFDLKFPDTALPCTEVDGNSVHGNTIERRKVAIGNDVFIQHQSYRLLNRHPKAFWLKKVGEYDGRCFRNTYHP
jgi:hypothetical protein